jgi:hypothetical protein
MVTGTAVMVTNKGKGETRLIDECYGNKQRKGRDSSDR